MESSSSPFEQSPSNHLPINPQLKCGESYISPDGPLHDDDDDVRSYRFHVALPPSHDVPPLDFRSRERSSGTGVLRPRSDETTSLDTAYDGPMDPHFFERGFYLEAKTGFQVWPGSRFLLEALLCDLPVGEDDAAWDRLTCWQNRLRRSSSSSVRPLRILELGSGMGVVGTTLAAAGGRVLVTDLPVLVRHGIRPNLRRNRTKPREDDLASDRDDEAPSSFLTALHPEEEERCPPVPVGRGYARPAVLDWFRPVESQLAASVVSDVDLVVACDCIFLEKIVDPLLDTLESIFRSSRDAACLFTYQRRNLMGVFIGLEELLRRIEERGWSVRCLAWRKIVVEEDGEHDLYLFETFSRTSKDLDGSGSDNV
ncbi:hypothetical protein ACHAWX_001223 [Stephanocyclus meneghinianus]